MAEARPAVADGNQKLFPCEVCGRCFAADVLFQRDKAHRGHKAWHGGKCMATGAGSWLVSFYLNRGGRLNEQEIGQPLERHGPICKKLFNKKRKPFDSLKQRLQGTDIPTVSQPPQPKGQPMRKSNWRQQHEDFINTIRSAKQCTLAIKEGRPLPPPPPPTINPDYIQCPYCMRRFNETAAQRHINFCKTQSSRCVFDPAQTAARLASRAQGKAQATPKKQPTVTSAVGTLLQNRAVEAKNEVTANPRLATDPASGGKLRQGFNKSPKKD